MKRLAYLVSEYPAVSHTFIYEEICELRRRGFDIKTFSINPATQREAMDATMAKEADETTNIKTGMIQLLLMPLLLLLSPVTALRLGKEVLFLYVRNPNQPKIIFYGLEAAILLIHCLREKILHIHVHFANPACTVAMLCARSSHLTYSVSVHGPNAFFDHRYNLLRQKFSEAAFVRAISHYCTAQVQSITRPCPPIALARCGIAIDKFGSSSERDNDAPNFLMVARLASIKGIHTLIEALKLIPEEQKFTLDIIGSGPEEAELQQAVQSSVHKGKITLHGARPNQEVRERLNAADVFLLPSYGEGLPFSIMEAMACGLPVVSTWINGIPELVVHNEHGLLCAPGDADTLAANMLAMMDPEERGRLSKFSRERVKSLHDIATSIDPLAKAFEKIG